MCLQLHELFDPWSKQGKRLLRQRVLNWVQLRQIKLVIVVYLLKRRPEEIHDAKIHLRQVALQSLLQVQFIFETKVLLL